MAKNKKSAERQGNTRRDVILSARNESQKEVLRAIREYAITIIAGPAGTGKTHLPVVYALQQLLRGTYQRIIFTRPCVEAYGENLGFLPGDFNDKIAPYMMPIFDILCRSIDKREVQMLIESGSIQTIPLAYQRGITFNDAIVIGDEFQNTIPQQLRMFLTRMGENCKIIVAGDPTQNDIDGRNGLSDALVRFQNCEQIKIIRMTHADIVRNPLVEMIDRKYEDKLPSQSEGNDRDY